MTRIYLDELTSIAPSSIPIETVKLIIEPESTATTKAIEIVNSARKQIIDAAQQREIIELIRVDIDLQIAQLEPGGDGKNVRIRRVEAN